MGPIYHHPNFMKGEIRKVEITPKLAQLRRETLIKPKWLHLSFLLFTNVHILYLSKISPERLSLLVMWLL